MNSYADSWEQCARAGLPISLDHSCIVELWTSCEATQEQRNAIKNEIEHAVITGKLKAVVLLRDPEAEGGFRKLPIERWRFIRDGWYSYSYVSYEIHRDDFRDWLKRTAKWPLPGDCLLSFWWRTKAQVAEACKRRQQQQIEAIIRNAISMGYDPKVIPDGGKAAIKAECLKDSSLFTDSGFAHAWKAAKKPPYERIQIENPERYIPRKR